MQLSKNWLNDYLSKPLDVEELAARLTHSGHAVDGVEARGDDFLLEIDITTNRPDCMHHLGMAREASQLFACDLLMPEADLDAVEEEAGEVASLRVEDHALCPSYTALVIRGVRIGPSPDWLVERLESIGSRSINNIVDITNFVLWETGQPLHAFDLDRIDGRQVIVRPAKEGEKLTTLDGESRLLDPSILVIADPKGPIALAGIMGGLDSEVTDSTVNVLLESAHFDPTTVRKGAKKLAMHTDASHRFERGADPKACLWAAQRAARLIVEAAGGEVLSGHLEATRLRQDWPPQVTIDVAALERFGGAEIGRQRSVDILSGLGFEVQGDDATLQVTVPSWRYYDFEQAHAQDVYEEVLRIFGFDNIPSTLPALGAPDGHALPGHRLRRRVQDTLAASGFNEAINFAFLDRATDAQYPSFYAHRQPMELANPLSDRYAVMRRSLLPNLVESARYNQRRGAPCLRLFEIGHIFAADEAQGRVEMDALAVVLGGHSGSPWERQVELDFFDLKGAIEAVAEAVDFPLSWRPAEVPHCVPGTCAHIFSAAHPNRRVGVIGQLASPNLPFDLYVAELALERLVVEQRDLKTKTPSKYPGISVDSTLTHALSVPWVDIEQAIAEAQVEHLQEVALKDRYQGQGVPAGSVNTTISFHYGAEDRSLTQEEINDIHLPLAAQLEKRFGRG